MTIQSQRRARLRLLRDSRTLLERRLRVWIRYVLEKDLVVRGAAGGGGGSGVLDYCHD